MDAFDILSFEHKHIDRELKEFIASCPKMMPDEAVSTCGHLFDLIAKHLQHQEVILPELRQIDELRELVAELDSDRTKVLEQMADLLSMHVDEQGYMRKLNNLLTFLEQHLDFTEELLYDTLRQKAPKSMLTNMDRRVTHLLFQHV